MDKKLVAVAYVLDKLVGVSTSLLKLYLQAAVTGVCFGILNMAMLKNGDLSNLDPFILYVTVLYIGKLSVDVFKLIANPENMQAVKSYIYTAIFYGVLLTTALITSKGSFENATTVFMNNLLFLGVVIAFRCIWKAYHTYALTDTVLKNAKSIKLDDSKSIHQMMGSIRNQTVKQEFLDYIDISNIETYFTASKGFDDQKTTHTSYSRQLVVTFTFADSFGYGLTVLKKTYIGDVD